MRHLLSNPFLATALLLPFMVKSSEGSSECFIIIKRSIFHCVTFRLLQISRVTIYYLIVFRKAIWVSRQVLTTDNYKRLEAKILNHCLTDE